MATPHTRSSWYRTLSYRTYWRTLSACGILGIASWIFIPSLYDPYVRVPSGRLTFAFECVPQSINIDVISGYAMARQAQIAVQPNASANAVRTFPVEVIKSLRESGTLEVHLGLAAPELQALSKLVGTLPGSPQLLYTVLFERIPNLDVQDIRLIPSADSSHKCTTTEYRGNALLTLIGNGSARVMHYKIVQEKLSDVVLEFNNSVANVVLAAMVLSFFWFTFLFLYGLKELYITRDKPLLARFMRRVEKTLVELRNQGAEAVLKAEYAALNRRLSFAKTAGPAFGFLLTVSSLSAALHPSVQAAQDTFRFVSGIQIAVIATFVGLAIRIVAHCGQRAYRNLSERILLLLIRSSAADSSAHDAP
jgi:hypothetical protein